MNWTKFKYFILYDKHKDLESNKSNLPKHGI